MKRLSLSLSILLLVVPMAMAQPEFDQVISLDPPLATAYIAVEVPTPEGTSLSGLRWFHNDDEIAFPRLLLMEGEPDVAPNVEDVALILLDLSGASLAWGQVSFEEPVTSSTGTAYAVFQYPEGLIATALGTGPGIGIREESGGAPFYLSGDGETWGRFVDSAKLGVEPVYSSGKMAARLLKDLKAELQANQPTPQHYQTALLAPRPNPFNPRTEVVFTLERPSKVSVTIFDLRGRHVRSLLTEPRPAGRHSVVWEGTDDRGASVASGVYFVRMDAGSYRSHKRLLLLK